MKPNRDWANNKVMRIIGITGGVGSGKSAVLAHITFSYRCKVILADEIAHIVKEPGQLCYQKLLELLGKDVLDKEGYINKARMSEMIFSDEKLREQVNGIIHPAVKAYIKTIIAEEEAKKEIDFLFIEAALLIEDGYENIVDELWYIYADTTIRRERLKKARGYSDEKIDAIMSRQLLEEEFRSRCKVIIENNNRLDEAYKQIEDKLGEYLCQKQENTLDK